MGGPAITRSDDSDDDIAFIYAVQNAFLDTYDRTDPRSDFHGRYCDDPHPCRHARVSSTVAGKWVNRDTVALADAGYTASDDSAIPYGIAGAATAPDADPAS